MHLQRASIDGFPIQPWQAVKIIISFCGTSGLAAGGTNLTNAVIYKNVSLSLQNQFPRSDLIFV